MSRFRSHFCLIRSFLQWQTPAARLIAIQGLAVSLLILMLPPTLEAQFVSFSQQGPKLVGGAAVGGYVLQGRAVALSADGNTAIVGGPHDDIRHGAVWVWTRTGGVWTQQGAKLAGADAVGESYQGWSVALSADGNTALVGGPGDNDYVGAVWVWTRTGGVWTQQGSKLVAPDALGFAWQGISVALSADGNTAVVGGLGDNDYVGAAWVWTRTAGVWTPGPKLIGSGAAGAASQGYAVALSADGNTALVGGYADNDWVGAVWVFTRTGEVWTQQGTKLVGAGADTLDHGALQGYSVFLSADGDTALIGGPADKDFLGAAWVWTRSAGVWTQQGAKLVGTGWGGDEPAQGASVSLSADGSTALVGGGEDNGTVGAVWVWIRRDGVWIQQGPKLVGSDAAGKGGQGYGVCLSGDGRTAIIGGPYDNGYAGAAWVFVRSPSPAMALDSPGNNSTQVQPFTLSGWAVDLAALSGAGVDTVHLWAYPSVGSPQFLGVATYGASRPDVGSVFGSAFTNSGFSLSVTGLAPGMYTLVAAAHSSFAGAFNQSRTAVVTIPSSLPYMSLDVPANGSSIPPSFTVAGWALDRAAAIGTGVDAIHVYAFPWTGASYGAGLFLGAATLGLSRPDVGALFGSQFDASGYSLQVTGLALGAYRIVAYAHSSVTGTFNQAQLADVAVASSPAMALDAPGNGPQTQPFLLNGWAVDLAASSGTGVDAVHVWAFPTSGGPAVFVGAAALGGARPDVGAFYGSQFTNSGYELSVAGLTDNQEYVLGVYAHSTVTGTFNQSRFVTITPGIASAAAGKPSTTAATHRWLHIADYPPPSSIPGAEATSASHVARMSSKPGAHHFEPPRDRG